MNNSNSSNPTPRRADALVRAGSPDPAPAASVPSNPERREGVTHSSGPKTPEGKSISSKNSTTHGLRAKKLENTVAPDMRQQYENLRRDYQSEYKPTGAIENTLFDMLVFAAWQLYKIRDLEMFSELDLGLMGSFGRSEKLARYRGSHERLFFRSLNQIKQIQQERALLATNRTAALPAHIPPAVRLKPLFAHIKSLARHPKTKIAAAATLKGRTTAPHSRLKLTKS